MERIDYARRLERIEKVKAQERMKNPTKNSSEGETKQIVADETELIDTCTLAKAFRIKIWGKFRF